MVDVHAGSRAFDDYEQHYEQSYDDYKSGDFDYQSEVVHDTYLNRFDNPYYSRGRGVPVHNMPKNRLDEFGNPKHCSYCKSICHWIDKCLHAPESVCNAALYHGSHGNRSRGRVWGRVMRGSRTTRGEFSSRFWF